MLGGISRLALLGVELGLDENLELKLEKNDPRRPCWFLLSFTGPLLLLTSALGRLTTPGRLLMDLGAPAEGVAAGEGEALDAELAPASGAGLVSSSSVVVGASAGFSVIGVAASGTDVGGIAT